MEPNREDAPDYWRVRRGDDWNTQPLPLTDQPTHPLACLCEGCADETEELPVTRHARQRRAAFAAAGLAAGALLAGSWVLMHPAHAAAAPRVPSAVLSTGPVPVISLPVAAVASTVVPVQHTAPPVRHATQHAAPRPTAPVHRPTAPAPASSAPPTPAAPSTPATDAPSTPASTAPTQPTTPTSTQGGA